MKQDINSLTNTASNSDYGREIYCFRPTRIQL